MQEKVKELVQKVMDWWNKFTAKQKTIIVIIAAAVVFTFAILIYVFTKPQYTLWHTCEDTTEAAEIKEILESAEIDFLVSDDALRISVLTRQMSEASLAIASAGFSPDDWSIDDVSTGMFGTESESQRRYIVFLQKQMESAVETYTAVKSAKVILDVPDQTGTLIASKKETSATVHLELKDRITSDQAAAIARAVATGLGNDSTANITVVDQDMTLLFSGEQDLSITSMANSMLQLKTQAEQLMAADVQKVLVGTRQYDIVIATPSLEVDYSNYEEALHEYSVPDGKDQGYYSHRDEYESTNTNSSGGVPGTDSNDEIGYLWQDGSDSESSTVETSTDYLVNELMKKITTTPGVVKNENSSITISAVRYNVIKEEDAKRQGFLDDLSWEEYKLANDGTKKLEVDEDMINAVANATRIPVDKITFIAYEEPLFVDIEGLDVSATDVTSIVLIIIILALLVLVVLRSMAVKQEVTEEEEISVESLLQSDPEPVLEDIEVETKSETRKMVEKFVDENPEAAANLLRNWLNEEWG